MAKRSPTWWQGVDSGAAARLYKLLWGIIKERAGTGSGARRILREGERRKDVRQSAKLRAAVPTQGCRPPAQGSRPRTASESRDGQSMLELQPSVTRGIAPLAPMAATPLQSPCGPGATVTTHPVHVYIRR